jgi:hypothetical protein
MRRAGIFISTLVALSIAAGKAEAQTPPTRPEPAKMSRADLEAELTRLRALEANGAVVQQRPPGCTAAENRQFDFWLGEWDVSNAGMTALVAESSITLADQGCVILEYWRPFQGASGHSINGYDAIANEWKQTWIDATGRITPYAGAMQDGTLFMDDRSNPSPPGVKFKKRRMNFRPIDANTVRQWGEGWDETKQAWVVTWDLTYRRRAGTGTGRP